MLKVKDPKLLYGDPWCEIIISEKAGLWNETHYNGTEGITVDEDDEMIIYTIVLEKKK